MLSENYEIVDSLVPDMGKAGVISFKDDNVQKHEHRYEEVLVVEKSKTEGVNLLAVPFSEIESVKWDMVQDISELEEIKEESNITVEDSEKEENDVVQVTESTTDKMEPVHLDKKPEVVRVLIGRDKSNE